MSSLDDISAARDDRLVVVTTGRATHVQTTCT